MRSTRFFDTKDTLHLVFDGSLPPRGRNASLLTPPLDVLSPTPLLLAGRTSGYAERPPLL